MPSWSRPGSLWSLMEVQCSRLLGGGVVEEVRAAKGPFPLAAHVPRALTPCCPDNKLAADLIFVRSAASRGPLGPLGSGPLWVVSSSLHYMARKANNSVDIFYLAPFFWVRLLSNGFFVCDVFPFVLSVFRNSLVIYNFVNHPFQNVL